jgi:hypothetical protein
VLLATCPEGDAVENSSYVGRRGGVARTATAD